MQRIVITSSCASVSSPLSKPTVFSEQDWNLGAMKEFQEKGNKTSTGVAYYASKTLAEKGDYLVFFFVLPLKLKFHNVSCNDQRLGIFMSSTSPRLNGI